MSTIPCPAPDCTTTWPTGTPLEVLLCLIDLHGRTSHPVAQAPTPAPALGAARAEKVKRPAAGTSEEWAYFVQRWSDYKAATHLTGPDMVFQLLECCDEALRKDLTRTFGTLAQTKCAKTVMNQYGPSPPTYEVRQEYAVTRSSAHAKHKSITVTL